MFSKHFMKVASNFEKIHIVILWKVTQEYGFSIFVRLIRTVHTFDRVSLATLLSFGLTLS